VCLARRVLVLGYLPSVGIKIGEIYSSIGEVAHIGRIFKHIRGGKNVML
jgi:hypothetical protein